MTRIVPGRWLSMGIAGVTLASLAVAPVFAQTGSSALEQGLRDRLQTIADTIPGGGTVRIDSVRTDADGATLSGITLTSQRDKGPKLTIGGLVVRNIESADGKDPEIRTATLTALTLQDKGDDTERFTVGTIEMVDGNLESLIRSVGPVVAGADDPLPELIRAGRTLQMGRLSIRDVALQGGRETFSLGEALLENVAQGQLGRLAFSAIQFSKRQGKESVSIGLFEVADTNYLDLQQEGLAIFTDTPDEDAAVRKILALAVRKGVLGRISLRNLKFKDRRNAFDLGEFTIEGVQQGLIGRILLNGMVVEEGKSCSEVCFNMAELFLGRTNVMAVAGRALSDAGGGWADEEKLAMAILFESELERLTVKGISVTSRDTADVDLGFFGVENYKAGSPDAVIMSDLSIKVPDVGLFFMGELQSLLTERHAGKWATRSKTSITGFEFKANEKTRNMVQPVLGADRVEFSLDSAAKWHEPGGKVEVRPLTVDVPDQFKFDFALEIGGLPPLDQYMDLVTNDPENEARWTSLGLALNLNSLTLSLEERGMVGRVLELAAKDMGMADREQLVAMIESEGPRNLGPVLGDALAQEITAKVAAFLRQGGRVSMAIAPRSEPLTAAVFDKLEKSPQKFQELIDLQVEHQP